MKDTNLITIKNLLFFVILVTITFMIIFKGQDLNELYKTIKSANILYICIGIILMFLYFLTEAYNTKRILHVLKDKNISLFKSLKFTLIGFFFSSITPAASGGQPVEIYYMTKEKIKGENATLAMLINLSCYHICTITLGLISVFLYPSILNKRILLLLIIGISLNGILLVILIICIFSKKLIKKIINIVIKILNFFKVKNKDSIETKLTNVLTEYNNSSYFIKTHKKEYLLSILIVLIQVIFYYSIPFCIVKAFGINNYHFLEIFAMQSILHAAVSSMPLPGTIGVSELAFIDIFNPVFGQDKISSAMLLNRGVSFYLFVILSMLVVFFNYLKVNKKDHYDS